MVIRRYSENRWLVHYSVLATCGCYYHRRILWFKQETEPDIKQIEQGIKDFQTALNEINNQR